MHAAKRLALALISTCPFWATAWLTDAPPEMHQGHPSKGSDGKLGGFLTISSPMSPAAAERALVSDLIFGREFYTDLPRLKVFEGPAPPSAFLGNNLLFATIDVNGCIRVHYCSLLDSNKTRIPARVPGGEDLLAFGAYAEGYIFVMEEKIFWRGAGDSAITGTFNPFKDKKLAVQMAPEVLEGVVYLFNAKELVVINVAFLREQRVTLVDNRIIGVSLCQTGDLLAYAVNDKRVNIMSVHCDAKGSMSMREHATIDSHVTSLMFLPGSVLALHSGGSVHAFYEIYGAGHYRPVRPLDQTFDSRGLENVSYNPAEDMAVAYVRRGESSQHYPSVTVMPFFRTTRILILNPPEIKGGSTERCRVSPNLGYLVLEGTRPLDTPPAIAIFRLSGIIESRDIKRPRHPVFGGLPRGRVGTWTETKIGSRDILDALRLLPPVLNSIVRGYLAKEFYANPQFITRFNCGSCYDILKDTLFIAGLNAHGKRVVLSYDLADLRQRKLSPQLFPDWDLEAFGAYPEGYVFVDRKSGDVTVERARDGKVMLSLPGAFFLPELYLVYMSPKASKNGLIYISNRSLRYENRLLLIDLKHMTSKLISFGLRAEFSLRVRLNEAGTVLACFPTEDTLVVYHVECDPEGKIDLVKFGEGNTGRYKSAPKILNDDTFAIMSKTIANFTRFKRGAGGSSR